ncbi:MAG: hypothetical protein UHN47_07005 [Lachnospiraceae bacterium]|nr:hypothetical protein [Lachnospiraceae bacterium]
MKKKIKNFSKKYIAYITSAFIFLTTKGIYYADLPQAQTDLGVSLTDTGNNLLNEITAVYCNSVGWLLFAISLAFYAFSKNEKIIGFAKKGIYGSIIVYIILIILNGGPANVIQNTVDTVTSWAGSVG